MFQISHRQIQLFLNSLFGLTTKKIFHLHCTYSYRPYYWLKALKNQIKPLRTCCTSRSKNQSLQATSLSNCCVGSLLQILLIIRYIMHTFDETAYIHIHLSQKKSIGHAKHASKEAHLTIKEMLSAFNIPYRVVIIVPTTVLMMIWCQLPCGQWSC